MTSNVDDLLRASAMTHGRIQLYRCGDGWMATVSHFSAHMTHDGQFHGDPVEALKVALLEDDRRTRDLGRRLRLAVPEGTSDPFGDLLG